MGDDRRRDEPRPGDPAEGVRIIGAEEAAEAIERGDVAPRRGGDVPRYGDRPAPPAVGPRPALRFPLDAGSDPSDAAAVRPASGQRFDPRPARCHRTAQWTVGRRSSTHNQDVVKVGRNSPSGVAIGPLDSLHPAGRLH